MRRPPTSSSPACAAPCSATSTSSEPRPGVVDAISAPKTLANFRFQRRGIAPAPARRLDPAVRCTRRADRHHGSRLGGDFYNTTLYDGRRISTATGGRQIDFSTVGSDFIGGISVLKTPDVSLASSSIGATVDIQFPKPFDHPGFRAAVSASGRFRTARAMSCRRSARWSATFADDTLGILSSFIYTAVIRYQPRLRVGFGRAATSRLPADRQHGRDLQPDHQRHRRGKRPPHPDGGSRSNMAPNSSGPRMSASTAASRCNGILPMA